MRTQSVASVIILALFSAGCRATPSSVVPNDNRHAAGEWHGDTLRVALEARLAAWTPDASVDSAVTVQAFAAADGVARIPGPLLRVSVGTVVQVRITNHIPDSTLVVHGLRPGLAGDDTITVASGTERDITFIASDPGTFLYWGSTSGDRMEHSEGRDGPLAGAIIVDPVGVAPDTSERVFVITTLDILPDSTRPEPREDMFDLAINGVSWPYTEQLHHAVGDTVRWRWLNATATPHPMHLHGFHFTVIAAGNGSRDSTYPIDARRMAVTEAVSAGQTFRMQWVPTRAGNWLFHCHIAPHIVPFPEREDSIRERGYHEPGDHAVHSMSGLVMGIEVRPAASTDQAPPPPPIAPTYRVLVQELSHRTKADSTRSRGYLLQRSALIPQRDSFSTPGPVIVLTRGQRTAIAVVNHLSEPTSVHWHGMELESYYDGVAGWSGADALRSPMVMPGDSFVAVMTPPRAGTFMYHPHMDEDDQLGAGLFGPLLVLEAGERFDPGTDLVFMMGDAIVQGKRGSTVNGARVFMPIELRGGTTYRLRFLNMNTASPATIRLLRDSVPVTWVPRAKDGADLPLAHRSARPARVGINVGETYDFTWRADRPVNAILEFAVLDEKEPFRIPLVVKRR